MYELWIRDGARVERVTTAADKGTLRRMWRVHRDAAITLRGEVLEFKTGCSDKARAPLSAAARQAFRDEPSQPAPLPPPEQEEPEMEEPEEDDDLEADPTEEADDAESQADGEPDTADNPEAVEPAPEPAPDAQAPAGDATRLPAPPRELAPGTVLPCGVKDCRCTARVPRLGTAAFACMPDFCEPHRTRARTASCQLGISIEAAAALLRQHGRVTRALVREASLPRGPSPTPAPVHAPAATTTRPANDRSAPPPAAMPEQPSPATVAEHAPAPAPAVSAAPAPDSTAPTINTSVTVTMQVPVSVAVPAEFVAARALVDRFGGADALARLLEGLDQADLARLVSFAREFRRAA